MAALAKASQHAAADQHPVPLPPERERAGRVPGCLQHLEPFDDIASRRARVTGWAVTGSRVRWSRSV